MILPEGFVPKDFTPIEHYFIGDSYAKKMTLGAGDMAITHSHTYDHMSVLIKGTAIVECDGIKTTYRPGSVIEIKANVNHSITAIDDVVWLCIHNIPEGFRDPSEIDELLIKRAELS